MRKIERTEELACLSSKVSEVLQEKLAPLADKYQYGSANFTRKVGWKPMILVLGNYSSGKSTFINEFLGREVQQTGQAPTDDSFTIITGYDGKPGVTPSAVENEATDKIYEREGKALLYDDRLPFQSLQKHGDDFAAHFRFKQVPLSWLDSFAIIDSPGMLDSVAEKDRGYNYQEVIGDLASMADLILLFFDPHKAGTINESYASLRETLPRNIPEDRLLFVMNRIDECMKLEDLLRVYGSLCWNLSQMIGKKDIPRISLSFSSSVSTYNPSADSDRGYLRYLENQREQIFDAMLEAPYRRLDHMFEFIHLHSGRMQQLLEALLNYKRKKDQFILREILTGAFISFVGCVLILTVLNGVGVLSLDITKASGLVALVSGTFGGIALWSALVWRLRLPKFLLRLQENADCLIAHQSQQSLDDWDGAKECFTNVVTRQERLLSRKAMRRDLRTLKKMDQLSIPKYSDGTESQSAELRNDPWVVPNMA